jgi:phage regulator Rha-like protein
MSSLEIAELVGSRHDKVKQSIERLAGKSIFSLPPMGEVKIQRERREETIEVYNLCKRDSLIVVAQLCPKFTAHVLREERG